MNDIMALATSTAPLVMSQVTLDQHQALKERLEARGFEPEIIINLDGDHMIVYSSPPPSHASLQAIVQATAQGNKV